MNVMSKMKTKNRVMLVDEGRKTLGKKKKDFEVYTKHTNHEKSSMYQICTLVSSMYVPKRY